MSRQSHYPRRGLLGWLSVLKWEGMREVDRANERRVNIVAFLWALSLIAVALVVAFGDGPSWIGWALAIVPAVLGLICLKAYLKLLWQMDEMLQKMQFEAMAIGFGTGMIIGNTLVVIDGFPREWIAPAIVVPMALAYTVRVILAARRLAHDDQSPEEAE